MTENATKAYEVMVIMSPDLTESMRDEAQKTLHSLLTAEGGKILRDKAWGMRDLAYTIKRHDRGFYYIVHFEQNPANISGIERELRIEKSILRHLIVSIEGDEDIVFFNADDENALPKPEQDEDEEAEKSTKKAADQAKKTEEKAAKVEEKLKKVIGGDDINL